jgi:FkbM family methyltransferase
MPILQGTLRGQRWIVGSSTHGCWLGTYEYEKQQLFAKTVRAGFTVYDLGGHVGFYTLLASTRAGISGRVVVFEPLPRNIHYLRRHLALNKAVNVTVVEAAVSDRAGTARFAQGEATMMGHLSDEGALEVKTVALDALIAEHGFPLPQVIKIDIEGGELKALQGAIKTLEIGRPIIFLATHGRELHRNCCELLASLTYDLHSLDSQPLEICSEICGIPRPPV